MNISKYIKENQIISIVGATATGKTAFAFDLAAFLIDNKHFKKIHLLSADSRQVYRGLENLTGADLPKDFSAMTDDKFAYPFFYNPSKNIFLHGVSIIEPKEEWSVAHFKKLFENIKANLGKDEFLIVVGGTGFYQQQISDEAATISIPQNKVLRQKLEKLNVVELQEKLKSVNEDKLQKMNNSDLNNPRRLIRAIEVALAEPKLENANAENKNNLPVFYLEIPKDLREQKIKQRVLDRFKLAKKEVEKQLENGKTDTFSLAASCTGFKELKQFIENEIDLETCLKNWQLVEIQYAKRQDTWWKKRENLIRINQADRIY